MNGLHGRAAKSIDGLAADALRQAGQQGDQARGIEPLLAFGNGAAEDEILDVLGPEGALRDELADQLRGHFVGPDAGQRAFLGQSEGRARVSRDHHGFHRCLSRLGTVGCKAGEESRRKRCGALVPVRPD